MTQDPKPIIIREIGSTNKDLRLGIQWFRAVEIEQGENFAESPVRRLIPLNYSEALTYDDAVPYVVINRGEQLIIRRGLSRFFRLPVANGLTEAGDLPCQYLRASGKNPSDISDLWDAITLTSLEEDVISGLRLIADDIQRLSFIGEAGRNRSRIPIVKTHQPDPVTLKSMGDGMLRIFSTVLSLVNAKDGFFLVDELDNGLHYSILPAMWKLIITTAVKLNVQVFATTHSWDCVSAFQQAVSAIQADGLLIRIEKRRQNLLATLFDERKLAIATREQIEVR